MLDQRQVEVGREAAEAVGDLDVGAARRVARVVVGEESIGTGNTPRPASAPTAPRSANPPSFGRPRPVPHPQNHDPLRLDPVAQDVGRDDGQFAPPLTRIAPAFGELGEAVRQFDQPRRNASRGGRVEQFDVADDRVEVVGRFRRPHDPQISRRGRALARAWRCPSS